MKKEKGIALPGMKVQFCGAGALPGKNFGQRECSQRMGSGPCPGWESEITLKNRVTGRETLVKGKVRSALGPGATRRESIAVSPGGGKRKVAASVCTGGCRCPPDICI